MIEKPDPSRHPVIPLYRKIIYHLMRLFFRFLYNEMAWSYDLVSAIVSLGRWKSWIDTTLPYLTGPVVLELGHGPGHLLTKLLQNGKDAYGVDISFDMGHLTRARLIRAQLPVNVATAASQSLPFPYGVFDHIIATFPTEYILDERTLGEVMRLLKPGGTMVVLPVAWITGNNILDKAAAWLFKVTGQSPQWDNRALEPAIAAGFSVRTDRTRLDTSEVLLVVARKTNTEVSIKDHFSRE